MPHPDDSRAIWRAIYRRARLNRRRAFPAEVLCICDDQAPRLGLSSVRFLVKPGVFHLLPRRGQLPAVRNS